MTVLTLSACDPGSAEWRVGPEPQCDTTSRGTLLLIAQSVPEASLIPCINGLPVAWEYTDVDVTSNGSTLHFETDTYDLEVAVTLESSCEVSAAEEIDSGRTDVTLFVEDDIRFAYVFEGGCIRFDYPNQMLAAADEGIDFRAGIGFLNRAELAARSGWEL